MDVCEFEASQGYTQKSYLKKQNKSLFYQKFINQFFYVSFNNLIVLCFILTLSGWRKAGI